MSLIQATKSELLKTKRTASFWLSIIGAAFIPITLFIVLLTDNDAEKNLAKNPWGLYMTLGWQLLTVVLLPVYIILLTTLITQIEVKNNTLKQVFASPQSFATIYFSKYISIQILIIGCYLVFNILLISSALLVNLFNSNFTFLAKDIDWKTLLQLNTRTYLSILGISAIQYSLSQRFKNFIVPVGVGLVLFVGSIVAMNYHWKYIKRYPYSFPSLTFDAIEQPGIKNGHPELYSIGCFLIFITVGYLEMKFRKDKG